MWNLARTWWGLLPLLPLACTFEGTVGIIAGATETGLGSADQGPESSDDGSVLDLGPSPGDSCIDRGNLMGVGPCAQSATATEFEAVVEWSWTGTVDTDTMVIPLVANLTDDDDNQRIDLCDVPDVLVTAGPTAVDFPNDVPPARLHALDGATGNEHWVSSVEVRATITPALADLDGDERVEIVTLSPADSPDPQNPLEHPSRLVVFDNEGQMLWMTPAADAFGATHSDAVALADLDLDGDPEIMVADRVFSSRGQLLFVAAGVRDATDEPLLPFAVNLDNDLELEVLWGSAAYNHDGTPLFAEQGLRQGLALVASLDEDIKPEIFVGSHVGLGVLDPDGDVNVDQAAPEGVMVTGESWRRPAAVHNIVGRTPPEFVTTAGSTLYVLELNLRRDEYEVAWTAAIDDTTGGAGVSAFDFFGDSTAEVVYADRSRFYVFGEAGGIEFTAERSSVTVDEYPVVSDVDNDGSAEILVGSNGDPQFPTVRSFGEPTSGWVRARRIWNQHTYHVTNISEDGLLPSPEMPHWIRINTFRANAEVEGGVVCVPEP